MIPWQNSLPEVCGNWWNGTKLTAARIATASGTDMIIANGKDVGIIHQIISGEFRGTLFRAQNDETFDLHSYLQEN